MLRSKCSWQAGGDDPAPRPRDTRRGWLGQETWAAWGEAMRGWRAQSTRHQGAGRAAGAPHGGSRGDAARLLLLRLTFKNQEIPFKCKKKRFAARVTELRSRLPWSLHPWRWPNPTTHGALGRNPPVFLSPSHPPCSCRSFPVLTPGAARHRDPKRGSCSRPTSSPDFSCLLQRVLRLPPGRARAARPGAAACPGGATAGAGAGARGEVAEGVSESCTPLASVALVLGQQRDKEPRTGCVRSGARRSPRRKRQNSSIPPKPAC